MDEINRDKTRVDPLTGAEEEQQAQPLASIPEGQEANATTAVIPGTGTVIRDIEGKEIKRVVNS